MQQVDNRLEATKKGTLFEWKEPREKCNESARSCFQYSFPRIFKVIAVIAIVTGLFYFLFIPKIKQIDPENQIGENLIKHAVPFSGAMLIYMYLVGPMMIKYLPNKYRIQERGIQRFGGGGHGNWFLKWDKIEGFTAYSDLNVPESVTIALYIKRSQRPRFIHARQGQESLLILEYLQTKLTMEYFDKEKLNRNTLADWQNHLLLFTTVVFSIPAALLLYQYRQKQWIIFVGAALFFAGPGTLSVVLLFGRRFFNDQGIRGLSFIYNMVGMLIIMLIGIYLVLRDLAEMVNLVK